MSGTSLDGVDFVLSSWDKNLKGKFLGQASVDFPKGLRQKLLDCAEGQINIREAAYLHHDLGRFYADSAAKIVKQKRWKIDLVGIHGQTVFHDAPTTTLQIGEPSYIATSLGVPVVADFRVADLAVGGQGAPLATFFHGLILKDHLKHHACTFHNLGGISNVSFFPKNTKFNHLHKGPIGGDIVSFDTGPANMLMDAFMAKKSKSYDENGQLAASGSIHFLLVQKWIRADKYFHKAPPKSCGREQYGANYLKKLLSSMKGLSREDQAATLTELTAISIAEAYQTYLPDLPKLAVFSGGGTKNSYLMFRIRYHLPTLKIVTSEDLGWPSQAIEGGAFAALAVARMNNMYGHVPQSTGASRPVLLGKIVQTIKK